ncbi:class III extradiol dioxygenase subunit B-like domain-containing protein [Streptomyces sp. NBC_01498]|uniref:class III extradiol dioxygenase subunit B-like domain-containing protein n=1 Tax=Streptomyces sp. NBC_01498 TaxID=2975870 RepID=UPI002E7B1C5D|nr:class III extradiol dioxygenase subunit B-like domain-containing protein [Streptomyces sp. NBC_01498]WTL24290.1 class III extradiol dioxygenase subunit B-like domain-containing protein [Streptomyces sp. NBC_01498]
MLVAAAVCPCPPLLVPAVAAGAAPELDAAREACADALGVLAASRPDRLIVVGPAPGPEELVPYPQGAYGTFRGYGVALDVTLDGAAAGPGVRDGLAGGELPASLAVAAWLLTEAAWTAAPVEGFGVRESLGAERCAARGGELAASHERVALLVMGDASACRSLKAPGSLDRRAAPFDAGVARALAEVDLAALRGLDETLATELKAAGRPCWQVLAGAAEGAVLSGTLLHDDAPYGVGYPVAVWS